MSLMERKAGRRAAHGPNSFLICLAVVTVVTVAVAAFLLWEGSEAEVPQAVVEEGFDAAAVPGALESSKAGDLNGMDAFDYRLNRQIAVSGGVANLRIENPVENRHLMKVTITLEEGTVVYATDYIKPYYSIEKDRLDQKLKKGEYVGTALIEAFDRVTKEKISETTETVQLIVE